MTGGWVDEAAGQLPESITVSDTIWEIRLTDGSTILGQVTAVAPESLSIRTPAGVTAQINRVSIVSMRISQGSLRDGRLWPRDPNRTRLFFGPTGRMSDAGDGYLGVYELFLPFLSFGVTDNLTIAGGSPIIPGAIGRVWYVAPKVGANISGRAALAGGVLAFVDADLNLSDTFDTMGIAYLVGTFGNEDSALTTGVGWGFAGSDIENQPIFLLGGETRTSERLKLVSENYFVTYRDFDGFPNARERTRVVALLSGGVRFIGERLSADAGIGLYAGQNSTGCCLPLVNFVYNFGSAR